MTKQVILTGLRANNDLHIGHYFGALLPMIDMATHHAGEYQVNLFVPDLHSFTTPIDHDKLYSQIISNLKVFAAAGLPLDHDDVYVYRQSYVPAHSELTWILDCFTRFGEMKRMTQFKEKAMVKKKEGDFIASLSERKTEDLLTLLGDYIKDEFPSLSKKTSFSSYHDLARFVQEIHNQAVLSKLETEVVSSVGLFNYPVLMAADILLYNALYVPVGDDQTQHLEYTRDIAERMNNQFGELFVVPKPVKEQHKFFGKDQGLRIRDLLDPAKKMSKSDETGKGVVFLTDSPETARKKIMSATTDSLGEVQYDHQKRPGISNLLDLLNLLGGNMDEFIGQSQYGPLKTAVADKVVEFLTDFQIKLAQIDEQTLMHKLEISEAAMNQTASETLHKVQQAVGLRPR